MLVNEKKFKSILILGAGAWGTTLAKLARVNGNQVTVWSRHGSQHLGDLINNVDMVLSAVSMKGVREVASLVKSFPVSPHTIFVTATKGLY